MVFIAGGESYVPLDQDMATILNLTKTVLIVNPEKLSYAIQMFGNSGVTITCEGKRHLGAVVGTTEYKEKYVSDLITNWISELESLSDIAESDPHCAYSAYVHGLSHKWQYYGRHYNYKLFVKLLLFTLPYC